MGLMNIAVTILFLLQWSYNFGSYSMNCCSHSKARDENLFEVHVIPYLVD